MTHDEAKRLSKEIAGEGGRRDDRLRAKCRWEHKSRTAVLMEWPQLAKEAANRQERSAGTDDATGLCSAHQFGQDKTCRTCYPEEPDAYWRK